MGLLGTIDAELQKDLIDFIRQQEEKPYQHTLQKVDDDTLYATRKKVEDTCRSMMASYKADVLTWKQYKDADGEQRGWADQAKMRANKTAASYNEFVLKNSYVWEGNVPADIDYQLAYIE